jgi:hypothetical protein
MLHFFGGTVKRNILFITLAMMAASSCLIAQQATYNMASATPPAHDGYTSTAAVRAPAASGPSSNGSFSRIAFGGGISTMGINLQTAVNANRFMNIRGTGNLFNYSVNNLNTNGMNVNGKLNFASLGTSVDIYPFPDHGFRLSPGLLLVNQNGVAGNVTVNGGTSFELNGVTYYASRTNPITGNGNVGLNSRNPAFTMTTGWGNMVSRRSGHLSFPVEVGAALVGAPSVALKLTGGQACDQFGQNCVNVATDPNVQANLQAQIQKYKNDMSAFQYFPIVSFGVAYNFNLHPQGAVR